VCLQGWCVLFKKNFSVSRIVLNLALSSSDKPCADHMVIKPNEAFEFELRLELAMPTAVLEQQEEMKDYYRTDINYPSKNQSFGLEKQLFSLFKNYGTKCTVKPIKF
jgi:hypothetical protein